MNHPYVHLTEEQIDVYLKNMQSTLHCALHEAGGGWDQSSPFKEVNWSLHWGDDEVKVHRRLDKASGLNEYLCISQLKATIREMQAGFYSDNTYDFQSLVAILYEHCLVDAAVLNITMTRTKEDPGQFFGVKYLQLYLEPKALLARRHSTYLELSGTAYDGQGRKTYYMLEKSIQLPGYGDADGVVRFDFSAVRLYREGKEPDSVQATFRAFINPNGMLPPMLVNQKSHRQWRNLTTASFAAANRRLTTGSFSKISTIKQTTCSVCSLPFNLVRKRKFCRKCGESMCKACTVKIFCVHRRPPKKDVPIQLSQERFCKQCLIQAKAEGYTSFGTETVSRKVSSINSSYKMGSIQITSPPTSPIPFLSECSDPFNTIALDRQEKPLSTKGSFHKLQKEMTMSNDRRQNNNGSFHELQKSINMQSDLITSINQKLLLSNPEFEIQKTHSPMLLLQPEMHP